MFRKSVECNIFEAEDITKYDYLKPLFEVLENIPSDMQITSQELWEQSGLDPQEGNHLLNELSSEFMNKVARHMIKLSLNKQAFVHTWLFDKVALLTTKVNTGGPNLDIENIPVLGGWIAEWRETRGV